MQKLLLESSINPQLSDVIRILNKYKNDENMLKVVYGVADDIGNFLEMFTSVPFTKDGRPNSKFLAEAAKCIDKVAKSGRVGAELITKNVKQDILKLSTMFIKDKNLITAARNTFKAKKIFLNGNSDLTEAFLQMSKEFKELKEINVQKALSQVASATQWKTEQAKKAKDVLATTINVAAKNVAETAKVATDVAKDPAKFYPMIVRQGNLIDKYVKVAPVASKIPEVKKAAENVEEIADAAKGLEKAAEQGAEAVKGGALAIRKGTDAAKNAVQQTVKAIGGGKTKIITGVIVTVAALVSAPLIAGWRERSSIAKVKELTENALNSKNYQDLAKYIGMLKKMQAKNTFMDKLMVADAASQLAGTNIENIKKGYTIAGATLICASIVLCLLVGVTGQVISSLKEMVSNFSFNSVLNAIGKLAFLGILLAPALIGVCLIKVAQDGFTEEGPAAFIVSMLAPVVSLSNYCIKGVLELIENAEQNKMNESGSSKHINNIDSDKSKYIDTLKKLKYQIDNMLSEA